MTKSSCIVNNSSSVNSNTCTIKQTTSTFNNRSPKSTIVLNGPATGFSSIITTTTTQCLNNQRKITELQEQKNTNKMNAIANDIYPNGSGNNSNNFVRGIFRSCNVNFGSNCPKFKSQKYITSPSSTNLASNRTPVISTTLNNSETAVGLTKLNGNLRSNGEFVDQNLFNHTPLRNESLGKNSKLINKAIQQNGFILKQVNNSTNKNDHKSTDVATSTFNYLTNSVSSPSLNSSESDEDDEEEETELQRTILNNSKTVIKQSPIKSSPNKLNSNQILLHNSNNLKASIQLYPPPCPLQRSKTLMLNSNGKPELNCRTRPQRIEITTTHHHPNNSENRSLVSSPVSTVSTKSVWYEYGCV